MAFTAAPGYGNLSQGNFSPTIFSQRALKEFRKTSVVEAVTNTDYFGEISNYGDTVRIMLEPDITITAYTRGAPINTQDLDDSDFTITVDKANSFQFAIDDLEQKQSHINFEELASNRAAYKIKDAFDVEVLDFMYDSVPSANYIGTTSNAVRVATGVTPSSTQFTPLGIMARVKRLMDVANIPEDSRFWVADPVFYEQLQDENSKLLDVSYTMGNGQSPLFNGQVMDKPLRGFKLYQSNNLPTAGTGPASSYNSTNFGVILAGHMSAVATVSQIAKTEKFRSQTRFADVVRGLHVYGRGVIRDESLYAIRYATLA